MDEEKKVTKMGREVGIALTRDSRVAAPTEHACIGHNSPSLAET